MKHHYGRSVSWNMALAIAVLFLCSAIIVDAQVGTSNSGIPSTFSRGIYTFNPTDDTYIGAPYEVNGNSIDIAIRNGSAGDTAIAAPALKFDISSVPANVSSQIISAKLYLYYYDFADNDPAGHPLVAHRFLANWNEETMDKANMPAYSIEQSTLTAAPGSPGVWISWDVKNDVQKFVSGALTNYGWIIFDEHYWGGYFIPLMFCHSKEYGSFIPYLEIIVNEPPAAPQITGQSSGKPGQSYDYTFITNDPNGDQVYLTIDWGDGQTNNWIGPYASNQPLVLPHSWAKRGTYAIKAQAKDTSGLVGPWGTLQVSMPLANALHRASFLERLFSRFPQLFLILRQWFGY